MIDSRFQDVSLLTNPYGGEVVKAEDPQQTIAPAGNLVYASLEKPSVKTTESNPFGFLIHNLKGERTLYLVQGKEHIYSSPEEESFEVKERESI